MKLISAVGARPQFIKAAAVTRAVKQYNNAPYSMPLELLTIHSGQHYDHCMSGVFFEELEISHPDVNLGITGVSHGEQVGRMIEEFERAFLRVKPHYCLVYGDTNTTVAAAMSAAKLRIPVVHVEAGLRSYNRSMPEELNRIVADHISTLLMCPTISAVKNLEKESITNGVHHVGDVMYDCILHYSARANQMQPQLLNKLALKPKKYFLTTVHRAENTDDPQRFNDIITILNEISGGVYEVVFPIHPRAEKQLRSITSKLKTRIKCVRPVSYLEMLVLESNAKLIITDSGGVQKEAFFLKIPCITLREETEWTETLDYKVNRLCGVNKECVLEQISEFTKNETSFTSIPRLFGQGNASKLIIDCLVESTNRVSKHGLNRSFS